MAVAVRTLDGRRPVVLCFLVVVGVGIEDYQPPITLRVVLCVGTLYKGAQCHLCILERCDGLLCQYVGLCGTVIADFRAINQRGRVPLVFKKQLIGWQFCHHVVRVELRIDGGLLHAWHPFLIMIGGCKVAICQCDGLHGCCCATAGSCKLRQRVSHRALVSVVIGYTSEVYAIAHRAACPSEELADLL